MKGRYEAVLYLKWLKWSRPPSFRSDGITSTERSSETTTGQSIADADRTSLNNHGEWSFDFDGEMNDDGNLYPKLTTSKAMEQVMTRIMHSRESHECRSIEVMQVHD